METNMDRETFAKHAGRTLWLALWADFEESEGRGYSGELDDFAPDTPDICVQACSHLWDLVGGLADDFETWAKEARLTGRYSPEERYAHCCALEAMGHGVTREDDATGYTRSAKPLRHALEGMFLYRGDDGEVYVSPDNLPIRA